MESRLPELTHLQFLVLGLLQRGPVAGKQIRSGLSRFGIRKSGPAFYQLMARIEEAGWIAGEYKQRDVGGQKVRERHYKILGEGRAAWRASQAFYQATIEEFSPNLAKTYA